MVQLHSFSALLLLAGSAAASPRFWSYKGSGNTGSGIVKRDPAPQPFPEPHRGERHHTRSRGRGRVTSGVLYLTTTITAPAGQAPVATTPTPAVQVPAVQPSNPPAAAPQAPAASAPAPAVQAPAAQPSPSTLSTQTKAASAITQPLIASSVAAPARPAATQATSNTAAAGSITADQILAIAPDSSSCSNAPAVGECATAAQAAPALNAVFAKYGISNAGAQAAVIAWEAFESADFKYKINHYPGTPGQGTRCMMSPTFVSQYATELVGAAQVASAGSPAAVLDLVNGDDEGSFGGGAWFMKAHCADLIPQFATSPDAAWSSFISSCVQTTSGAERDAIWTNAKKALGVA